VLVVGWGQNATSAAFGDVNGDGRPDVVIVSPQGDSPASQGSVVKIFLNHRGRFNEKPDYELAVPQVDRPHKVRVTMTKAGPYILVAGKTAALLAPLPAKDRPRLKGELPGFSIVPFDLGDGNYLRFVDEKSALVSRRFGGFYDVDMPPAKPNLRKFVPDIDGPYTDVCMVGNNLLTSYGQLYRPLTTTPAMHLPVEKDWSFLAVGDFNGDGRPDAAFLNYGMEHMTAARVFYGRKDTELLFRDNPDVVLPLGTLLTSARKNQRYPLVRDTPVVADWNGDGIDDLVVAHGQSDEVLVFLGSKSGLSQDRVQRISLEYRVHYEHGVYVGDFNGDGKPDLAVFGDTNTGVGAGGPPAVYVWLQ
jgi:hypothetical protein